MKTLLLLLLPLTLFGQISTNPDVGKTTTVIKIDPSERERIEQWTKEHTFPDIIVFVEDSLGNFIIGKEVLTDPAYEKLVITDDRTKETESIRSYLSRKSEEIEYRPKPSIDDVTIKPR